MAIRWLPISRCVTSAPTSAMCGTTVVTSGMTAAMSGTTAAMCAATFTANRAEPGKYKEGASQGSAESEPGLAPFELPIDVFRLRIVTSSGAFEHQGFPGGGRQAG